MEQEMHHSDEEHVDLEPEEVEEVQIEYLNEKMESIMQKLESLNVDKEIGEKEKNRDTRLIIERIELENFKSYAGVRKIGPLHHVSFFYSELQCRRGSKWLRKVEFDGVTPLRLRQAREENATKQTE